MKQIFLIYLITTLQLNKICTAEDVNFVKKFDELLWKILYEKEYRTIFVQDHVTFRCLTEVGERLLPTPLLRLQDNKNINFTEQFNINMLAILCLGELENSALLKTFARNLQHMRQVRVIVTLNSRFGSYNDTHLLAFFERCEELRLTNIILLHTDCFNTQIYHSYDPFPRPQLEVRSLNSTSPLFPNRFKNLHGKAIVTIPDLKIPRTILYFDKAGQPRITGYVYKLLKLFANYHNASLQYLYEIKSEKQAIWLNDVPLFTINKSIDIGMSLQPMGIILGPQYYTNTIELSPWLIMLPVENTIPIQILLTTALTLDLLVVVLVLYSFLLLFLFMQSLHNQGYCSLALFLSTLSNDTIMRGLLGQPFRMLRNPRTVVKIVYFLTFIAGLFITTAFSANLVRLITAPPTEKPLTTYDDLIDKNMKILFFIRDVKVIKDFSGGDSFWQKYSKAFKTVNNSNEMNSFRDALNPSYAYTVTTSLWNVYQEQQKYMGKKLFRLEWGLRITLFSCNALPLQENSYYKEPLNRFISILQDGGFIRHWKSEVFYDMLKAGKISFQNTLDVDVSGPLRWGDFYWIWLFYIYGCLTSIVIFLIEKIYFHWNS